jgi:probable F420-dependent oxidoreductase
MDTLREALGTVGIWSMELRGASRPEAREAAAELDELGYPALWFPGLDGTGVLDDVDGLLTAAPRATVALGVMGIWGQDPATVGARLAALDATHGPRALIGLGISNPHSAATAGQDYGSPTGSMADYLDQLDGAPSPVPASRRFLGALGPKMADLAVARTAGWHPFMVTPEYNAIHRARVGAEPLIAPHQAVVLDRDPARARAAARAALAMFIGFPAYRANLARLGFTEEDLVPGGSDRLIDAVTAWGHVDDVARPIQEHLDAGADHVTLHVLNSDPDDGSGNGPGVPRRQWRELAALLPDLRRR